MIRIARLAKNKKRAISPVIAVILLIGLAVAASAAIFLVVLPLLQPTSNLEMNDAYIIYDTDYTVAADEGEGYGKGTVSLSNAGTGSIKIKDIQIYYATSFVVADWTEITEAVSIQDISVNNPYVLDPLTTTEELTIRFPLPERNDNNTVAYKIIVTPTQGSSLDTTKVTSVSETDMELLADRPQISFTGSLGTIRRTRQIAPTSVTDNSQIKNVVYEVYNAVETLVRTKTITQSLWRWQWNTFNFSSEGLDNGSYTMKITVNDYAGLSNFVNVPLFTIDNDYEEPKITNVQGLSTKNGIGIAEVGEFYAVSATITDSGSAVSSVSEAYIYYKLDDGGTTYSIASMTQGTGDTWTGNIPGAFIGTAALANNLTFYLKAIDDDSNEKSTGSNFAEVKDTTSPNFITHIFQGETIESQTTLVGDEGTTLSLSVEVSDKDSVNQVNLVWRERNDIGIQSVGPWIVSNNISVSGNVYNFRLPALNVTLDGLEYYFNASDPSNNIAYEGNGASPYRIRVYDEASPIITIQSTVPATITEGTDLTVSASIIDNDPSFSWTGFETGTVLLGIKRPGESVYTNFDMTHTSGDSSIGETPIWEIVIDGANFSYNILPVLIRIQAIDDSGESDLQDESIAVSDAGEPNLSLSNDAVSGADNHLLNFDIINGQNAAAATITDIKVRLLSNGKTIVSGDPLIVQIDTGVTVWQNDTNTEGANNTIIPLDSTVSISGGTSKTFTLTYANSTTGNYDLYDLTVSVTLYFEYGVEPYTGSKQLAEFDTPITQTVPVVQTRYMRSNTQIINGKTGYELGTSLTGSIHLSDGTSTYSSDLAVTWGIQVYIRHSDFSQNLISGGIVATVQRPAGGDAAGIQNNYWNCPETSLTTSDAILVQVWCQVGGNSPELQAEFITNQLGAAKLDSATWNVYYYTERDRGGGFFSRTTTAYFHWGESIYNSRIEGFQYSTYGGGGAGEISYLLKSDTPQSPILETSIFLESIIEKNRSSLIIFFDKLIANTLQDLPSKPLFF